MYFRSLILRALLPKMLRKLLTFRLTSRLSTHHKVNELSVTSTRVSEMGGGGEGGKGAFNLFINRE